MDRIDQITLWSINLVLAKALIIVIPDADLRQRLSININNLISRCQNLINTESNALTTIQRSLTNLQIEETASNTPTSDEGEVEDSDVSGTNDDNMDRAP